MSVSITTTVPPPTLEAGKTIETETPSQINSIDDLIRQKAATIPNTPLIAYPASEHGCSDLVEYTAKDLDRFADETAKELTRLGLRPKDQRTNKSEVVALLGPSNFDYVVSMLAISRMGFTVMFLSTRLPTEAYISLLEKTACTNVLAPGKFLSTVENIQAQYPLNRYPLLDQSVYGVDRTPSSRFQRSVELIDEENCISFIVHSSGSTGLPKPIFQTHRACLSNYALGSGLRAFVTLPLFHNHGLSTTFRGIVSGKRAVLYNANLPLTNSNLIESMKAADPESFHGVPYALKVLAETEEGIAALRKCNLVLFGGSSCPDDLGDKLVENGVYLVGHYGATEMGQLMTSFRDPEDKAWNYVRPLPKVMPYLKFVPVEGGVYECVVLDGLPTKVLSNSDDPPNSFYTRDTFVPHPTIPNAWKYLGRLDDRVTLVNGEKVLPVPYEHYIRQNELVQDCLVFGIDRAFPGLLVIPSEKAKDLSKKQLLELLEPEIKIANSRAEKFGHISIEMVEILDFDTDYPRTDKGTMIRAACYRRFAELIDSIYVRFETPDNADGKELLKLEINELHSYLQDLFTSRLGVQGLGLETDFFEAGTDSLQSITARGQIMRELDLSGSFLSQNAVYEYPSIKQLAQHLYALRTGSATDSTDDLTVMKELIRKYSKFPKFTPRGETPHGDVVVLTGATGSLGAHILAQLVALPHVDTVYCLVRASSQEAANIRIIETLSSKKLLPLAHPGKLVALPADLSQADFALEPSVLATIRNTLTTVIHSAWAVNFNLGVASFESHHIRGTYNLLRLCQSVPFLRPARFSFVSSISVAAGTPLPAVIEEKYLEDPSQAQNMGYARSKFVTESIVRAAGQATGQDARVLRTGQIVGDTKHGLWNPTEAIPLMIRAAVSLGALPRLDETPSWLPVDKCAEAIVELAGVRVPFADTVVAAAAATPPSGVGVGDGDAGNVVYHVQNDKNFRWTEDLLPALRNAGLQFETVSQREWVQRLREGEQDPEKNPTVKLLDFFTDKYDNDNPGRKGLEFKTQKTGEKSEVIREGVDVVGSGLVSKFVAEWSKIWVA